jgi:tetratricopeptide (TPR) repeat protein
LRYYEQALAIWRAISDRRGEGVTLNNLGLLAYSWGKREESAQYYAQALIIRREVGDRAGEGATLNNLGMLAFLSNQLDESERSYKQALAIRRDIGDRIGEGKTLNNLGTLARTQCHYNDAAAYFAQALTILEPMEHDDAVLARVSLEEVQQQQQVFASEATTIPDITLAENAASEANATLADVTVPANSMPIAPPPQMPQRFRWPWQRRAGRR